MPRTISVGPTLARALAVVVMACAACHAASPASAASTPVSLLDDYGLQQWTVEDGLPERVVQCVGEDSDGYLWVATIRHLLRFDGIRFVDAGSPGRDFDADPRETMIRLHAAADGTVYVLTTRGVRCFGPRGWTTLLRATTEGDSDDWRNATLTGDDQGFVHLGVDTGITTFREAAVVEMPADDMSGWAVVGGVPQRVVGRELEPHPVPDRIHPEDSLHLEVHDGVPTVVDGSTVYRWNDEAWEAVADCPPLTRCALVDRTGGMWCGGDQGIREHRHDRWAALETGKAPVNVAVRSLLEDSSGAIWAATNGGLVRFRRRTQGVRVVSSAGTVPGVRAAWIANDGSVWVTPERGGVCRLDAGGDRFDPVEFPGSPADLRFDTILVGAGDDVWLGTDGAGLWHGTPGSPLKQSMFEAEARRMAVIATFAGDPQTRLWIGSGEGLFYLDHNSTTTRTAPEPNTTDRVVEDIFPDSDGTLWIGRQDDWISQIDPAGETVRRLDDAGLPRGSVWSFHRDRRGTLWAGGNGRLMRLTSPVAVFDVTHGLPDAAITQIEDSASGLLWVGTRDGLFAGDLSAIERAPPRRGLFRRFDADGPLAHANCSGRINKHQRAYAGDLLFPSAQGLVVLSPEATVLRRTAPRTIIESIAATRRDGSVVEGTPAGIAVPADATGVAVEFTALHMAAPDALRFRYRVSRGVPEESTVVVDDDWTRLGRDRRVVIRGLTAGRHTFEVRASLDGKYATEGAAVAIDVEAHFWQRPGFVAACGAAAAAAVAAILLAVLRRRYHRRLARERELQQERERIARDIHDDLGAGLTQVAHLSAMAADHEQGHDASRALFQRICTATTGLARSLDEIVWAVNPANDSLDKLVSYLAEFAQEFAGAAGVACRLNLPHDVPDRVVSSRVRHNVCMLLKESLNNAVLHGLPSEIMVTMRVDGGVLRLTVLDDGRGFDSGAIPAGGSGRHSGIPAMRHRAGELGGRLTIESLPGAGTTVDIAVEV